MIEAVALRNYDYEPVPEWLKETPEHLKTREMYDTAFRINPTAFFLFLTVLKLRACVILQCAWNHTFSNLFLTV